MIRTLTTDEFLNSASEGVIVDVRTPAEFEIGHIVGAVNIPLFTNEERAVVGTIYKRVGRDEAVEKGLEFVGLRLAKLVRKARQTAAGRPIYMYCWRGGMRSGSMAWLFSTAGMDVVLLKGGYKAYRRSFETIMETAEWRINLLSGATGSGKTELLQHLEEHGEQVIDLEGLANHKGSVFGAMGQDPQPTTEHFINLLHNRVRQLDLSKPIWCEGESMLIGHVFLPQKFYDIMRGSQIYEVVMSTEQRLDRLMVEYGDFDSEMLSAAFKKIQKRLGNDKTQLALELLAEGNVREAARIALWYYDKAYVKSGSEAARANMRTIDIDNNDMKQSALNLLK